jgi:hypothetical protein
MGIFILFGNPCPDVDALGVWLELRTTPVGRITEDRLYKSASCDFVLFLDGLVPPIRFVLAITSEPPAVSAF